MKHTTITPEQFSEYERYYRRMMELYPDRYTIMAEPEEVPPKERPKWPRKTPLTIRKMVIERDGRRCAKCGQRADLQVHHIRHRSDGGADTPDNLVTLCNKCHADEHKGEPIHRLMLSRFLND